jgi:4-hydroxy-2-oxoglutarate aldolase
MSVDLGGTLVAAATPFADSGELDTGALSGNVRYAIDAGVRGILICGSTAETVYLDDDERAASISAARDVIPSDRILLVGTGAESTRETHALTAAAADAGADVVLVQPPAFYLPAMTFEVLRRHYNEIADASSIPVAIYQVPPRFSTVDLQTELIAELSDHPNIIGIKDSRGSLEAATELVEATTPGFQVMVGSGAIIHGALKAGATGAILGVANLAPAEGQAIYDAWRRGDDSEAASIQARIAPLHNSVIGGIGIPGVKAGLDMIGLRGGTPRPPLLPLDSEGRGRVRDALEQAGIEIATAATGG